jgi:hypothetical protein
MVANMTVRLCRNLANLQLRSGNQSREVATERRQKEPLMHPLWERRPSPSMIVALIALFIALGGTGYAAVKIANNSVHSTSIKNGEVKSGDLANNAVIRAKIKDGAVSNAKIAGGIDAAKIAGTVVAATNATNAANAVNADKLDDLDATDLKPRWAHVSAAGVILAQSGGITVTEHTVGKYTLDFGVSTAGRLILVSPADQFTKGPASAIPCGGPPEGMDCGSGQTNTQVRVITVADAAPPAFLQDHAFYLALMP